MINRAGKYFPDPHPELARRLDAFLERLKQTITARPELGVAALVLAGGYGRGEGGVFKAPDGTERLYNDLEFYLISKGMPLPSLVEWARATEHSGTAEMGIAVEIKVLSERAIARARPSMFFYDLACAHQVVSGPEDYLVRTLPAETAESWAIPLHEATRLLFNRGSGLLFCGAKLEGLDTDADEGFIHRNHAKAKLALGDAVLAAGGTYHWSCLERANRLKNPERAPPDWPEIARLHAEGVEFKLCPRHPAADAQQFRKNQKSLVKLWASTFLWLEMLRLRLQFEDLVDYARAPGRLLPEFPAWQSLLCRIRDLRLHDAALPRWMEYPRGVLQRALAAFLSRPDQLSPGFAAEILGCSRGEAFERYRFWWGRYN